MWPLIPALAIILAQAAQPGTNSKPAEWCFDRGQDAQLCEATEAECNKLRDLNPEIAKSPCKPAQARNSGPTERAAGTPEPGAANPNPTIGHADDCEHNPIQRPAAVRRVPSTPPEVSAIRPTITVIIEPPPNRSASGARYVGGPAILGCECGQGSWPRAIGENRHHASRTDRLATAHYYRGSAEVR